MFSLEGELNEELLKLLITVVDTELLKAIVGENLETIDVQDANNSLDLEQAVSTGGVG